MFKIYIDGGGGGKKKKRVGGGGYWGIQNDEIPTFIF